VQDDHDVLIAGWQTYCHQENGVDAQFPLLGDHYSYFTPEDACGDALVACGFSIAELLRFGESNTEEANADGQAGCNPLLSKRKLVL
jgi:hypothetical protein